MPKSRHEVLGVNSVDPDSEGGCRGRVALWGVRSVWLLRQWMLQRSHLPHRLMHRRLLAGLLSGGGGRI
eukprot:4360234-Prymnesium_polylepis.1